MNRELLDRYCERGILGLGLAILAFGPLAAGAVRTPELALLAALTSGVLMLWGARLWLSERPEVLWPPVCWAVTAFVLYAVYRYATCDIEYVGRLELLCVLIYAALFFAIINNLHRQETTQIIGYTLIFLAMALAVCAVWQALSRTNKVPALNAMVESLFFEHQTWYFERVYRNRASGTYINPNHLAGFLEMVLPLAFAYVIAGRGRQLTKVFLGYAALVIMAGIALTGSRGSWAATGGSLFLLFVVLASHRSYRMPAVFMLILLIGGGLFLVGKDTFFKRRLETTFVRGQVELDMRQDIWAATVDMWRDHLWLGVGPGHYDYRFREYRPQKVQLRPDRAHNEYLNVLADWGIAGAAILAALLGLLVVGVLKAWRHVRRSEREFKSNRSDKFAFVAGASFGLVAIALHSAVDFNLHLPANAILAMTWVALLSSHLRFATQQHWSRAGMLVKSLATVAVVVVAAYLAQQSLRLGREAVWLTKAKGKGLYSDAQIHDLEQAHAIEPQNFETTYALGEARRVESFEGGDGRNGRDDYRTLAQKAMLWYSRGTNTNPHDGYNYLRYGECLDFLGQTNVSAGYFARADELDPNGYWTSAMIGRHYREIGDFAAARVWSERSLHLQRTNNLPAEANLQIATDRLLENAMRPAVPARK